MNELVAQLTKALGVQANQAQGGAGLLLKLAQSKLGGDFGKVAAIVPDAQDLIKAAPEAGGAVKLLGGLAGALGGGKAGGLANLASLADGFGQLKLDPSMVGKFIPQILAFVQSKGGHEVVQMLAKIWQK